MALLGELPPSGMMVALPIAQGKNILDGVNHLWCGLSLWRQISENRIPKKMKETAVGTIVKARELLEKEHSIFSQDDIKAIDQWLAQIEGGEPYPLK
jgi:hypothetical protein